MTKLIAAAAFLTVLAAAGARAEPVPAPASVVGVPITTPSPAPGTAHAAAALRYRYAAFSCSDGHQRTSGSPTSCKSEEDWENVAAAVCAKRCDNQRRKCGLNGLIVRERCQ